MAKINIRNLYIDLLNKIKQSEGVSKEYVDGQVSVIDQHLTSIDGDITAINSVIPETASATNLLLTESDLAKSDTYGPAAILNISDALPVPVKSLVANAEPIQDLHGYDKPWVGGAGKNKLPLVLDDIKALNTIGTWSGNVYTIYGVKYTVNTDNGGNVISIKANGNNTTSNIASLYLCTVATLNSVLNGSYVLNGCPSGGGGSTYRIFIGSNIGDTGDSVNFSTPISGTNCGISVYAYYNAQNVMFYPMIRLATETDSTFAPYSNICPISGWTESKVTVADDPDEPTISNTTIIDLNGTRYGGYTIVDENGVTKFVGTHGIKTVGELTWNYDSSNRCFQSGTISDMVRGGTRETKLISSTYECKWHGETFNINWDSVIYGVTSNNNPSVFVHDHRYTDATTFKTAMADSQIVYPLATPIEVTLSNTNITLLDGYNNVSCDSGDIEISTHSIISALGNLYDRVIAIEPEFPAPPTTDGSYNLTVTVSDGAPVYTWEATT